MKLSIAPEIPENLVKLEQQDSKKSLTINGKDRGRTLGDAAYEFIPGRNVTKAEVVWTLKNNAKRNRYGTGSGVSHWLNYYYSSQYSKNMSLFQTFNFYKKHWHALAALNFPILKENTKYNLMKESSLILSLILNSKDCNLSKERWRELMTTEAFQELFLSTKKDKEKIVNRFTTIGNDGEYESNDCINYRKLLLDGDDIDSPLFCTNSFEESYSQLSKQNQINLRMVIMEYAKNNMSVFEFFITCFELEDNEYDNIASALENNETTQEDSPFTSFILSYNKNTPLTSPKIKNEEKKKIMLCEVTKDKTNDFIEYLNNLCSSNRIAVLTSNRLKLSAGSEVQNICLKVIESDGFKRDDFSIKHILEIIRTLEYDNDSTYDWDHKTYTADFNNECFRRDINKLLMLTHMPIIQNYQELLDMTLDNTSESDFIVDLITHNSIFKKIFFACKIKQEFDNEQKKTKGTRRHFNETNRLEFDVKSSKNDLELSPLTSKQLLNVADELLKKERWVSAVKLMMQALDNSVNRLAVIEKIANLVIMKKITKYYATTESKITFTIDKELSKTVLERANGTEFVNDLMRMMELDVKRNNLDSENPKPNKKLIRTIKETVLLYNNNDTSIAKECKSLLSKIWSQIIKRQQPGTSDWLDSLLWKFKVSSSIETREELSTILKVNYYEITNTRRSYFPYETAPLNRQEKFVMSVIYLRIMLLTGKHPQFKDIKKMNEAINDCFRFEIRNRENEVINKVVHQRVRDCILTKMNTYSKFNNSIINSQTEISWANECIYSHFKRCLQPIEIEWDFINLLTEYAKVTKTEINPYSKEDLQKLFVFSIGDADKAIKLLNQSITNANTFEIDAQLAESYLTLIKKHKLRQFNSIIPSKIDALIQRFQEQPRITPVEIKNKITLVDFESNLPHIDKAIVMAHLDLLQRLLREHSDEFIKQRSETDKNTSKTINMIAECWIAISKIHKKNKDKTLLDTELECERYSIYFRDRTTNRHKKQQAAIAFPTRYTNPKKPTQAMDLIYTRLAYIYTQLSDFNQYRHSFYNATIERATQSCFENIYYRYHSTLQDFFQQDKGPSILKNFKAKLRQDIDAELEAFSKAVKPVELNHHQAINALVNTIFSGTESVETLRLSKKINDMIATQSNVAKEYCHLIRERLSLCKSQRRIDISILQGNLMNLSDLETVSLQQIIDLLTHLLNSNNTQSNGLFEWGRMSRLYNFIQQQVNELSQLQQRTMPIVNAYRVDGDKEQIKMQQEPPARVLKASILSSQGDKDHLTVPANHLTGIQANQNQQHDDKSKKPQAPHQMYNNHLSAPASKIAAMQTKPAQLAKNDSKEQTQRKKAVSDAKTNHNLLQILAKLDAPQHEPKRAEEGNVPARSSKTRRFELG